MIYLLLTLSLNASAADCRHAKTIEECRDSLSQTQKDNLKKLSESLTASEKKLKGTKNDKRD